MTTTEDKVVGYECKHAIYTKHRASDNDDDHILVKLEVHYASGITRNVLKPVRNYERDFYITAKQYRDHEQKKTAEHIDRLIHHEGVTDSRLAKKVAEVLGMRHRGYVNLREVNQSPYVYGTDDTAPTIIKRKMSEKYPDLKSPYSVCAVDIETDVTLPEWHPEYGKIIMVGATMKDKAVLAVTKKFLEDVPDAYKKIMSAMQTMTPEEMRKRNIDLRLFICDTPGECTIRTMECIHEWRPDFLSTWNMAFDVPRMVQSVEDDGIDPADVFSDPCVPREFRKAYWKEGPKQKKTASGKYTALDWNEQWHTFECPASYYWLDSGAVYRWVRTAKGKEPSYKLNAILQNNINMGKLNFQELGIEEDGLEWHKVMQAKHKIEYCIYNLFDCVGLELLDEKTRDLSYVFPILMGISEYKLMPSEPKRLANGLVSTYRAHNQIMAGSPKEIETPMDQKLVSLRDWIVTLPCHLLDIEGVKVFRDNLFHNTKVYTHVADLDVTGAYPSGQVALNISRETTRFEVCSIQGVTEQQRRSIGINLTAARVNAVQIASDLYKMPRPTQVIEAYDQRQAA